MRWGKPREGRYYKKMAARAQRQYAKAICRGQDGRRESHFVSRTSSELNWKGT